MRVCLTDLFFPAGHSMLARRNYLNLVIRTNGTDEPRERATVMPPNTASIRRQARRTTERSGGRV